MAIERRSIEALKCACERCGHVWFPDVINFVVTVPTSCAKCKSPRWQQKKPKKKGFLYVIGHVESGMYKIGVSIHPEKRLAALQTGSPIPLAVIGQKFVDDMFDVENSTHKRLVAYRVEGEWFKLTHDQAVAIVK